jgi:two-component system, NarL family, response regulator NreC
VENGNTYRILIADDQVLFRRGLRTILAAQPDMQVTDEASSLEEAFEKAARQTVDLILMNAALLQAGDGCFPPGNVPTLLLTNESNGGPDEIARTASSAEIVAAVRSRAKLARKDPEQSSAADLQALAASTGTFATFPGLTIRESEILRLLVEGLTAREAAKELGLSIKTVEAHKLNVMRKLGLHNRASLIRFAAEHGAIPVPA